MPGEVEIRHAGRGDLEAIVALLADDPLGRTREDADGATEVYAQAFAAIADDPNNQVLVAVQSGRVIGCLQLTFIPGLSYRGGTRAQIEAVRVASSSRGSGVGRQMVKQALATARARNCVLVQLTTDKRRPEAVAFYEALGFRASHEGLKLWF